MMTTKLSTIIPIGPKIDIRPAITILTKCATFLIAAALSFFAFFIAFSRNRLVAAFAIFPAPLKAEPPTPANCSASL